MLNNMGNFYLSCFEIANPIYTIIRFGLQECGDFTWRVSVGTPLEESLMTQAASSTA